MDETAAGVSLARARLRASPTHRAYRIYMLFFTSKFGGVHMYVCISIF